MKIPSYCEHPTCCEECSCRPRWRDDPPFQARLRALTTGWQRATLPELHVRCIALAMARTIGGPLPPAVRDAWVKMVAVLEAAAGGRAR